MADIGDWFRGLPQFTKYWFGGTVALSLVARFGIISPFYLILQYQEIFHSYQVLFNLEEGVECESLSFI